MLIAEQVALDVVRGLRMVIERVQRRDRALGDQLRRAASSVVLNIAEGSASEGGNARVRYATAAGSSREVSAALRVAAAWGYVDGREIAALESGLDRVRRPGSLDDRAATQAL